MQRSSSWMFGAMILAASLSAPALAAPPATATQPSPAPGELSNLLPDGVEMFTSMFVSDSKQIVGDGNGMGAAEARIRARKECQSVGATDCVELITFPIRNQCVAMAVDKEPTPKKRAIFAASAVTGTPEAQRLGPAVLEKCNAAGGRKCGVNLEHCF